MQGREGTASPSLSLRLTGLKETLAELPGFVRLAADMGVGEVYLQRLVFFDADPVGLARWSAVVLSSQSGRRRESSHGA